MCAPLFCFEQQESQGETSPEATAITTCRSMFDYTHHISQNQQERNVLLPTGIEKYLKMFTFAFSHLADAFIQSDLQMRTMEAIKINKRAMIHKCYNKSQLA